MPLVIFGSSNILSDLADAAWSQGLCTRAVVLHEPPDDHPRSLNLSDRLAGMQALGGVPQLLDLEAFTPQPDDLYLLGPTTPRRAALAALVEARWGLHFMTLVHRTAYVSPAATLGAGVFVGAGSIVAPGTRLADHVFVNRGVTVGHDNQVGPYTRIQPGAALGGLSSIGRAVSIGLGVLLYERLAVGDGAVIAAGSVVRHDVQAYTMVAGSPARMMKRLQGEMQA